GTLISSNIKTTDAAGIPYQMIAVLVSAIASFAVFMYASPKGYLNKALYTIFSSAVLVVLWGLPSHFGYDPTCLLFRGTFDVSCWTSDFQPRVRIFSTLGQPDWMAAYVVTILPVLVAIGVNFSKGKILLEKKLSSLKNLNVFYLISFAVVFAIFYLSLLYTQSRAAILAFWLVLPLLAIFYFWFYLKPAFSLKKFNLDFKVLVFFLLTTLVVTFFAGQPFGQLSKFTYQGLSERFSKPQPVTTKVTAKTPVPSPTPAPTVFATGELGGTDSGIIRLLVWNGAISIWKANPIFGSGLETYAFSYYKFRPAAHNLTSEAKFLYNKAHNEFLNYLATTGTFGIVTYLSMIGGFLFITAKYVYKKRKNLTSKEFLITSIIAGYFGILITNFFGFSVVMINIFFYTIPAFVFVLAELIDKEREYAFSFSKKEIYALGVFQKGAVVVTFLVISFLIYSLVNFWQADRNYYFGVNYDHAQDYQKAYVFLKKAVDERPDEPVFRDEFAYNNAVLGAAIASQISKLPKEQQAQETQIAKQLIDNSINLTNQVTTDSPNNIVFWKTKTRIYYTLGQVDPSYLTQALSAIKKSMELAPTDADVSYNLGVLYGQTGDVMDAIKTLQNTIVLKRDYYNAYYALAIFYRQAAVDQKGNVINPAYNQKAIEEMQTIIKVFGPNQHQQVLDAIKAWSK
ncbi:MAG TPA: O-antigen ligase family protein, partial [Candidatus Sulfotelmatobacter sp.]|nr:O-antigen ligase family protein [Candidatus Sulfotelmatobacter sp.]